MPKIEIITKKDSQLAEKNGIILTLIGGDNLKFYNDYKILILSLALAFASEAQKPQIKRLSISDFGIRFYHPKKKKIVVADQ